MKDKIIEAHSLFYIVTFIIYLWDIMLYSVYAFLYYIWWSR